MHSPWRARRLLAGAAIAASLIVGAACGDDDDDSDVSTDVSSAVSEVSSEVSEVVSDASDAVTDDSATETTGDSMTAGETVELTAVDYAYEGIPDSIAAGSTLTLHNDSTIEVHEAVVLRIPDDETRSVEEIAALSEEEQSEIFPEDAPPAAVIVALPGEDGQAVVGTGAITEPGRYAVVCFIPLGADPDVVREAMESGSDEQPDLGDGPPHVTQGMFAELVVE